MSEEEKSKKKKIGAKVKAKVATKKAAHRAKKAEKAEHKKPIEIFHEKLEKKSKQSKMAKFWINVAWCFVLLVWVFAVLYASQFLIALFFVRVLNLSQDALNSNATQAIYSAVTYVVAIVVTIFVPWCVVKFKTTRDELGLRGLPTWTDIGLSPVAYIASTVLAIGIV